MNGCISHREALSFYTTEGYFLVAEVFVGRVLGEIYECALNPNHSRKPNIPLIFSLRWRWAPANEIPPCGGL